MGVDISKSENWVITPALKDNHLCSQKMRYLRFPYKSRNCFTLHRFPPKAGSHRSMR